MAEKYLSAEQEKNKRLLISMKLLHHPFLGMLILFVVTALPAAALMFLIQTPLFEARARIAVNGDTDMPIMLSLLRGNVLAEDTVAAVGTEQLFPSAENNEGIRQLQKQLKVQSIRNARLIEIRFRHPDEELAVKTVNTLIKLFEARLNTLETSPQVSTFREQLVQAQKDVVQAKTKLAMFSKNAPQTTDQQTATTAEQQDVLSKRLAEENEKQKKVATDLEGLRQQFAALAGEKDDKDAFLQLKLYEHELLRKYEEQNSLIASVRQQLTFIKKQIQTTSPDSSQQIEALAEQIVLASSDFSTQEEKIATLQRQLDQLTRQTAQIAGKEKIPLRLEREMAASKERLTQLLQQMETDGKTKRVTVIERPLLPLKAIRPNKLRIIAAAICFGLLCSLLLHALRQGNRTS